MYNQAEISEIFQHTNSYFARVKTILKYGFHTCKIRICMLKYLAVYWEIAIVNITV